MYNFDLKNVVPSGGLTCLFAKATIDESNLWHRRLSHINFKTMNKLVRGNLVRGLPLKLFENDHTCVACQKGKQHKASCKTKLVSSISQPLQMLHIDLFRPTSVRSINHKTYCLVVTDDYSRFIWVFFSATKDETSGILKTFITGIENLINDKFSVARTPQQNRVAERKNKTLIEAARTMLADSLLPTTFWAEAVSTTFYVQNKVLVTKPYNKTPYELLLGRPPSISFMGPFGCPVTILNTLDPLGTFDEKDDKGFFVGYSINRQAFMVFNTRTRKVEENLHITFLENIPNVARSRPDWLFDIDLLTNSMNYEPTTTRNQTNKNAGIKDNVDAVPTQQYILLPLLYDSPQSSEDAVADDAGKKTNEDPIKEDDKSGQGEATNTNSTNKLNTISSLINTVSSSFTTMDLGRERVQRNEFESVFGQDKDANDNSIYRMFTPVNAAGSSYDNLGGLIPVNVATLQNANLPIDPLMLDLEDTTDLLNYSIFSGAYDDEDVGTEDDLNNLETTMNVSPIPTTRIHKDHPKEKIIRDPLSAPQTRRITKSAQEHAMVSYIKGQRRTNHKDYQNCLFACFLSQIEPKKKVWRLLNLPKGRHAIGIKWVYRNKKDERGIVVRNKARLVAQGYTYEEGIDYDEVFAPVARIEVIRLFLAYALFMGFIVYQMDVKSAFLYDTIEEEVYVCQPPGFEDPQFPDKVYKVEKALYGLWFQFTPKVSHLYAVKRIFRYLKGQPKLGLWYPRESPFDLEDFSDSNYASVVLDREITMELSIMHRVIHGNVKANYSCLLTTKDRQSGIKYAKELREIVSFKKERACGNHIDDGKMALLEWKSKVKNSTSKVNMLGFLEYCWTT
ncbi:putative ribonuclease H-like domain-containing protein [Tanacetum coccineum]|uniref:Ribonuclease H-like domain-containing protein n=1 Tax=Tanacetum coccineum TaxID=301880 RepID=A0ABQ5II83_9ASTR